MGACADYLHTIQVKFGLCPSTLNPLQNEFRKLENEAGKKTSNAIISIMELRATQFEEKMDQLRIDVDKRFNYLQWMMGTGFSLTYNNIGQLIRVENIGALKSEISLYDLEEDIYLLRVYNLDTVIGTIRIIRQN